MNNSMNMNLNSKFVYIERHIRNEVNKRLV